MKSLTLIAVLTLLFLAPPARAEEQEIKIALDKVPAKILDAARKAVPGIQLACAAKETEKGQTVYELVGTHQGRTYEIEIDAGGKVLEVERAPSKCPGCRCPCVQSQTPRTDWQKYRSKPM
jgi:hypothetical protein